VINLTLVCTALYCLVLQEERWSQEAVDHHDACQHAQGPGQASGAEAVRVGGPLGVLCEYCLAGSVRGEVRLFQRRLTEGKPS
jgi:hypothetical protein